MTVVRLSYVVVTDHSRTIGRLLPYLLAQTARREMELVIVTGTGGSAEVASHVPDEFGRVRLVEHPTLRPMGGARAAGVRTASAPIVFLGETHSFPAPDFARAIIDASAARWDVLVPGFENANPENAISWSNLVMDYGSWHRLLPPGHVGGGPTWNVAYRRSVLVVHDEHLDRMLSHGDDLAVAFRAAQHVTLFLPSAQIAHANLSQPRWWFEQRYLAGLLVADSRRKRWSAPKRLVYALASPLIPFVIIARLGSAISAGRRSGMGRLGILAVLVGALFRTAGEVTGYLVGAGPGSQVRMDEYELYKLDFTSLPH